MTPGPAIESRPGVEHRTPRHDGSDVSGSASLVFEGLSAPVLLDRCDDLLPTIRTILPGWPFTLMPADQAGNPIATIAPAPRGRYSCTTLSSGGKTRIYDAVDTVCDMIVELSWEMLRSGEWLMCLHAAAIEMAGRLVIVPNMRRAGKSTLTACLAKRGFGIFSDDFVPVSLDDGGRLRGHANGICPRLRLPVPAAFSAGFRDWVADDPGPANRHYKYLTRPDLPPHGTARPLGAIVILDRRESGPVDLSPMDDADAVAALLYQNFARSVHSATILQVLKVLLSAARPMRLRYADAEAAADCLARAFDQWEGPPPAAQDADLLTFREVDERDLAAPAPDFHPARAYARAAGITEMAMNGQHYLTDASGLGIHGLNAGALAIWRLLDESMRLTDLVDLLAEVFPETPRDRIEADCAEVLRGFVTNRLVEPQDVGV